MYYIIYLNFFNFDFYLILYLYIFKLILYILLYTANPLRVTFKKGVIKQDGQKYALPKNESRVSINKKFFHLKDYFSAEIMIY